MPAMRLADQPVAIRRFDVAGKDAQGLPCFVQHAGLSLEFRDELCKGDMLRLIHMMPPFRSDEEGSTIQTVGTADLTADELLELQVFVDERQGEYQAARLRPDGEYVIRPHAKPHREADGTVTYWRYNCAGFVIEAYASIEIDLVDTDESSLPLVPKELVAAVYGETAIRLARSRDFGIDGDGPWPIVMAGYVLNSLNRDADEVRKGSHTPTLDDCYFPKHEHYS